MSRAELLHRQALEAMAQERPDRALQLWQEAIGLDPHHRGYRNNLALVLKRLERYGESEALLRELW